MEIYNNPIPSVEEETSNVSIFEYGNDYTYKENVYFAFIDVLGFKKAFDDHRDTDFGQKGQDVAFADKFKKVFVYYFELMNASKMISQSTKTECYAGQTSDSLYFYSPREDGLIEYIKIFLHFNLYAMTQDVFFRGGIAKGNLFIKEPFQFYGESVIFSYLLESGISKHPKIVLDEDTYNSLKRFPGTETLLQNEEKTGRHYLNIFAPLEKNFVDDFEPEVRALLRDIDANDIQKYIQKNKKKFEYDAKNYEKYKFLEDEYKKNLKKQNNN